MVAAAATGGGASSAAGGLLRELRSWVRYLSPSSKYVAVYYPTPMHVVRAMLRVAGVTQQDTVFDLGCGDGRIVITAAEEFGARGLGVELDPALAQTAAAAVQQKGLADRVRIQQGDARGLDASSASVITLYLNEKANRQLLDGLKPGSLRAGTRVVSLFFPIQGEPWSQWLERVDKSMNIDIHLYIAGGAAGSSQATRRQPTDSSSSAGSGSGS